MSHDQYGRSDLIHKVSAATPKLSDDGTLTPTSGRGKQPADVQTPLILPPAQLSHEYKVISHQTHLESCMFISKHFQ